MNLSSTNRSSVLADRSNHGSAPPDKKQMKALVAIASYGTNNDGFLAQLVKEYQSMSFPVDIVVLTNAPKEVAAGVELCVVDLRNKDPWSLPFPHKEIFADRIDQYDLFIYSEDDTLISEKNLRAFLEVSAVLEEGEIPGFLRFEESPNGSVNFPEIHGHFHWEPRSIRERQGETFAFFTNEHAACYALTRDQLRRAVKSGGFLVGPHKEKYDLLCTAATDPYTQCGMEKLICISRVDEFLIHHLPNKYVGSTFGVDGLEFRRQLEQLLRIGSHGGRPTSLFPTETKLPACGFSKGYYEPARPEILDSVPAGTGSVLSVGCGRGSLEAALAERGLRVVALPLDPIIPGEALAGGVEVVIGDLDQALGMLGDRKFDCLVLSNVLHLVPDPAQLLQKLARYLRANAVAIVVTPNLGSLSLTWKRLRKVSALRGLGDYEVGGVQLTTRRAVKRWLRHAGLTLQQTIAISHDRTAKIPRLIRRFSEVAAAYELILTARKNDNSQK